MTDLREIRGLSDPVVAALGRRGIDSVEALWSKLASPELRQTVDAVAAEAKVDVGDLLRLLADDAADRELDLRAFVAHDPGPRTFRLADHVPDVAAALAAVLLVVVVGCSAWRVPRAGDVLVAAKTLPAGWTLRKSDLELATLRGGEGLTDPGQAPGRITVRPLAKGEVVREGDLGPAVPAGSAVLSLPLAEGAIPLRPEETVSLLLVAPRLPAIALDDVLVLGVGEASATFAVGEAQLAALHEIPADARALPIRGAGLGPPAAPALPPAPAQPE